MLDNRKESALMERYVWLHMEYWDERCGKDILEQIFQLPPSPYYTLVPEKTCIHQPQTMTMVGKDAGEMAMDVIFTLETPYGGHFTYWENPFVIAVGNIPVRIKELHEVPRFNFTHAELYSSDFKDDTTHFDLKHGR